MSEKSLQRGLAFAYLYACVDRIHIFRDGDGTYRCANHAEVTTESFSLNCPTLWGLSVTTTTAFCTVERVTSGGRLSKSLESIWREQAIPKSDLAGISGASFWRNVKYENSSVDLESGTASGIGQSKSIPYHQITGPPACLPRRARSDGANEEQEDNNRIAKKQSKS